MLKPWLYSVLGLVGFLVGAYLLLMYGLPLLLPFAIALLVAELIEPVVSRLTLRGRIPRTLSVTVVLLIVVALISMAVTAAVGRLVHEILRLYEQLPYLYAAGLDVAEQASGWFGQLNESVPGYIQNMLQENLGSLQTSLEDQLPGVAAALSAVSGLPALVTNILIATVATFFMSRDRRAIGDFLLTLFPAVWRPKLRKVKTDVWVSSMGFVKAQAVLISMTMIQSVVGLYLIGSNYALLVGLFIGIADLMPILGPAAIYLPWVLYSLIFGSKIFGLKLLILYVIVAGVRQVLEAKVVGDQLGLHPLAILVSIYLGFQFFGALGFVVGPLLAILLKALVKSGLLPIFQEDLP